MTETEQRRTEPLGKAGLDAIADRDAAGGLEDYAEVLTVKERLLRRARRTTYRFEIVDGEEVIPIDTRRMTSSEREQAIIHYDKIQNLKETGGGLTVINESIKALQQILNGIVIDKELDFTTDEEWITDDVVVGLVNLAMTTSWGDSGAEIRSFQPDADGPSIA